MTFVNRVAAYFLTALAVCLLVYSILIYVLIRQHLYGQFDSQLRNALNVVVAAVEVEPDGVKWQPTDHTIDLGNEREVEEVRWIITDEKGELVDKSSNLISSSDDDLELMRLARTAQVGAGETLEAGPWRLLQRRLRSPSPKPAIERDDDEFAELQVIVGRSAKQLHADLLHLIALVCILPVAMWIPAAIVGRNYSRRAIKPVVSMSARARSMTGADFSLRLPVPMHDDELSSLATSFNGLLKRLQEAYQQQQRFTGDAAHQLRTPLTVLRGEIDLALRRSCSEAEYRKTLSTLSLETKELQQIVEDLLFLARTQEASTVPRVSSFSLARWLNEVAVHWRDHLHGYDLNLIVEEDISITTSELLLRQALDNLIDNAAKYSPNGSPIVIKATLTDGEAVISVTDCGAGISAEDQRTIFEPFVRSADARRSGVRGTGLGLAIVARIAEALGGSVDCQSRQGYGSTFSLHLPQTISS